MVSSNPKATLPAKDALDDTLEGMLTRTLSNLRMIQSREHFTPSELPKHIEPFLCAGFEHCRHYDTSFCHMHETTRKCQHMNVSSENLCGLLAV